MVGGGVMRQILDTRLNQVTLGLALALALITIVASVLIAPRSNEQVIELVPLKPAEVQATANPATQQLGATTGASVQPESTEIRTSEVATSGSGQVAPANLDPAQTPSGESTSTESTSTESTIQELPTSAPEVAATSSQNEQVASETVTAASSATQSATTDSTEAVTKPEMAASESSSVAPTEQTVPAQTATSSDPAQAFSSLPGAVPTRATEKISDTPYLEQIKQQIKQSTAVATNQIRSGSSRSNTNRTIIRPSVEPATIGTTSVRNVRSTPVARNTVTRSSLPLRRDAGAISVQAGAFKSLENAQKLASRLQAAGIRAGVDKGKTMYRVLVGPYSSESDARAAARGVLPLAQ
jgi:cell division septation protein DedD